MFRRKGGEGKGCTFLSFSFLFILKESAPLIFNFPFPHLPNKQQGLSAVRSINSLVELNSFTNYGQTRNIRSSLSFTQDHDQKTEAPSRELSNMTPNKTKPATKKEKNLPQGSPNCLRTATRSLPLKAKRKWDGRVLRRSKISTRKETSCFLAREDRDRRHAQRER